MSAPAAAAVTRLARMGQGRDLRGKTRQTVQDSGIARISSCQIDRSCEVTPEPLSALRLALRMPAQHCDERPRSITVDPMWSAGEPTIWRAQLAA
jgi:hypothetical protein